MEPSNNLSASLCIYKADSRSCLLICSMSLPFRNSILCEDVEAGLSWDVEFPPPEAGKKDLCITLGIPRGIWEREIWRRRMELRNGVLQVPEPEKMLSICWSIHDKVRLEVSEMALAIQPALPTESGRGLLLETTDLVDDWFAIELDIALDLSGCWTCSQSVR